MPMGTLLIHSFSYSKISPLSLCFHVENDLADEEMSKERGRGLLLPKTNTPYPYRYIFIIHHICIFFL